MESCCITFFDKMNVPQPLIVQLSERWDTTATIFQTASEVQSMNVHVHVNYFKAYFVYNVLKLLIKNYNKQ